MPQHLCDFKKSERLCSKIRIADLFANGNSFAVYPFRVVWKITSEERKFPVQVAFSVAKRKIRKAVKRNLLKRRIRESYRHHKACLYEKLGDVSVDMMIIYLSSEVKDYQTIDTAMDKLFEKLIDAKVFNKNNDITG